MSNTRQKQIINDSVETSNFSETYPFINQYLKNNGSFVPSRNGDTMEIIDFKTTLTNPYKRSVGNNKRDMNIFFLLAEAMWIWAGRKDVEFLQLFNSRMGDYSDDGKVFHAPYGFRLRKYGINSYSVPLNEENQHHAKSEGNESIDQIKKAVKMLSDDPESRRVVLSIWNPELDLDRVSKDLPCNDLLMLKIRENKLRATISNRSNDLHWGLPTNVFQFSFISEVLSNILDIEMGTQTHNSQSLHFYLNNPIALNMNEEMLLSNNEFTDLYDNYEVLKMKMNFVQTNPLMRLQEVDYYIDRIIRDIFDRHHDPRFLDALYKFDEYLWRVYHLLRIYVFYKDGKDTSDYEKLKVIEQIKEFCNDGIQYDFEALAVNFFYAKLKDKTLIEPGYTTF